MQIDVPETLSVGTRAGFYEETGAFRDMVVTHLFQVLGFVAMEPPTSFSAKALLDETVKVFQAMAPLRPRTWSAASTRATATSPASRADSQTETFVALRVGIENWRWAGVPFYLRTGKRMAESRRLLTITFRDPPRRMFDSVEGPRPQPGRLRPRRSRRDLASFLAKVPGPTMRLAPARFRFDYDDSFAGAHELEAYERLIHDALWATARSSPVPTGSSGSGRSPRPSSTSARRCSPTSLGRGARRGSTSSSPPAAGTYRSPRERARVEEGRDAALVGGRRVADRARVAGVGQVPVLDGAIAGVAVVLDVEVVLLLAACGDEQQRAVRCA